MHQEDYLLGIVKDFWKKSSLAISAGYQNNEHQEKSKLTIFNDQELYW